MTDYRRKEREIEEEEEAYERRKLEKKLREKEAAYQEVCQGFTPPPGLSTSYVAVKAGALIIYILDCNQK